jgi:hypothetical protein
VAAEPDAPHFGVRMTLPEPIGLQSDVMAGLDRLLDRLCAKLAQHRMGARRVRLELRRVDRGTAQVEIGLARPMRDPARIAALFAKGVDEVDAGFGIDALRLTAPVTEAACAGTDRRGPGDPAVTMRWRTCCPRSATASALTGCCGCCLPTSLIPERSFLTCPGCLFASEPIPHRGGAARPITLFPPEPVTAASGNPPARFRWRRMRFTTLRAPGRNASRRNGGSTIPPGGPVCAITGGSRPGKGRGSGCFTPRKPRTGPRPEGRRTGMYRGSSHDPYAELCVTSNFTFLTGASHPEELVTARGRTGAEPPSPSPTAIRWPAWCGPSPR